jgi:hypothetical protein
MKLHSFFETIILAAWMGLIMTSCSQSSDQNAGKLFKSVASSAVDEFASQLPGLTMDKIIAQYDTTNLTGVFSVYNILRTAESGNVMVENHVQGKMYNPTNRRSPFSLKGNMEFNQIPLVEKVGIGLYFLIPKTNTDVLLHFGKQPNTVSIPATDFFKEQKTPIMYSEPVRVNNVQNNTVVSRSQPLRLTWSGSGKDYVSVALGVMQDEKEGKPGTIVGALESNTGFLEIPVSKLQTLQNGKALLEIRRFEPQFITLSNRQRIAFIGISGHSLPLVLKD